MWNTKKLVLYKNIKNLTLLLLNVYTEYKNYTYNWKVSEYKLYIKILKLNN